jgi:hypothetical protein
LKALRAFSCIIILSISLWDTSLAQNQIQCKAIVQNQIAKFSFPLPDKKEFIWNQSQSEDNYQEYTWQVSLEGTNPQYNYNFGVFLFKFPGAKEKTGSLKRLFSMAQYSVWDMATTRVRDDLPIDVIIENDKITVLAKDSATIKALFSHKPTIAHFMVQTPYKELNLETKTPIEYAK